MLFDAVVLLLDKAAGQELAKQACAIDFVKDAFSHLKAIGFTPGAEPLLAASGVEKDDFFVPTTDVDEYLVKAGSRYWAREPKVRPRT